MRRFFIFLFVVSLLATAVAVYWASYLPEASVPVAQERGLPAPQGGAGESAAPSAKSVQDFIKKPSERQNMAVTISILSSIISALAAIVQTWLTARAYRRRGHIEF
jgi:hypothetical protein